MPANKQKPAVHFGAGNIGRGFIGQLLTASGYHVIFVDVQEPIIDALNEKEEYKVHILDGDTADVDEATEGDTKQDKDKKASRSRETQKDAGDVPVPGSVNASGAVTPKVRVSNFSGVHSMDPAAVDAVAAADIVTTSVGPEVLERVAPVIAKGLAKRCAQFGGAGGEVTVIACENMVGNTDKLEGYVRAYLESEKGRGELGVSEREVEGVLGWVDKCVGWANCEVDRIVPPFDPSSVSSSGGEEGEEGEENPLHVGVEGFYEWVVERGKVRGDVHIEGMQMVENLTPFIERKLYTLNCGHALCAYVGYVRGYETVYDAIRDPEVRSIVEGALRESGKGLCKRHGWDEGEHGEYIERTLGRFGNASVRDELTRVGRRPLRKLGGEERLVGPVRMCMDLGLPRGNLVRGIGSVYWFDVRDDEEAGELGRMVKEKGVGKVVEETTGFERGSEEWRGVLEGYEEFGRWKREREGRGD